MVSSALYSLPLRLVPNPDPLDFEFLLNLTLTCVLQQRPKLIFESHVVVALAWSGRFVVNSIVTVLSLS